MMYQRLLPAYCQFFANNSNANALAHRSTFASFAEPRLGHALAARYMCTPASVRPSARLQTLTSHHHTVYKARSAHRYSSSSRLSSHVGTDTNASTQPHNQEVVYGPVINRFDARTHLDDVEDAVNSSLAYYLENQSAEQSLSQSNNNEDCESGNNKALLTAVDILNTPSNILNFPPSDREVIGVASNLKRRLNAVASTGVDCRRCWLQKRHCICQYCLPLEDVNNNDDGGEEDGTVRGSGHGGALPNVNRLFLLTHHKEICLTVDTAKLILSTFPKTTRLVVSGIGREFQPSMGEMLDAVSHATNNNSQSMNGKSRKCLILFPTEDAITFDAIRDDLRGKISSNVNESTTSTHIDETIDKGWDVIVIDGTWSQARKMHAKYFPCESTENLYRVQLSDDAVNELGGVEVEESGTKGHQLRRHPIKWREISTLEATRLLLNDMHTNGEFEAGSNAMVHYQELGNDAAKRQLGPPRRV